VTGFVWHQVDVEPLARFLRHNGWYCVLRVNDLNIYISPTGRTRVFRTRKHQSRELK
jgi:hypothetical protein